MFAYFTVYTSWPDVLRGFARRILFGESTHLAAQLAYYFTLTLFPGLICLVAFASLFPLDNVTDQVAHLLQPILPSSAVDIVRIEMLRLAQRHDTGVLGLGLVAAIWSTSAAMNSIMAATNRAYGIEEHRAWWKTRLTSVLMTIGLSFFFLAALMLILAGPQGADFAARKLGTGAVFAWTWKILEWPIVVLFVAMGIRLVYHFAPDADDCWVWITPGSALATVLALSGSIVFRLFVLKIGRYEMTYGTIGEVIVLLLWCYVTAFALVAGIELDALIERGAPWSQVGVRKVAGSRKCIGPEAARRFDAQQDASARAD